MSGLMPVLAALAEICTGEGTSEDISLQCKNPEDKQDPALSAF